jgi:hypothetical protein
MVTWRAKIRLVPCPMRRHPHRHSRSPATPPASRTGRSDLANQMRGGDQGYGMAGHAASPPMAPRLKRWSSVRIDHGPSLFRLPSPDLAWGSPRSAFSLADVRLSLSLSVWASLLVRPLLQGRGRAHRDSWRLVLPRSGRSARSRRGREFIAVPSAFSYFPSVD